MSRDLNNDPLLNSTFQIEFGTAGVASRDELALCNKVSFGAMAFSSYVFKEGGNATPITIPMRMNQPIVTFDFFVTRSVFLFEWIERVTTHLTMEGPSGIFAPESEISMDIGVFSLDDVAATSPGGDTASRLMYLYRCVPQSYTPFQTLSTSGNALATEKLSFYYFDKTLS